MSERKDFFHFENITVDSRDFRVTRNDEPMVLTPRAFDVLLVLLRNAGRVVEKQQIFESVWKDTFVTDNALVKVVKEIRNALGDDADSPHLIETVPKRGYRFIGDVSHDETASTPVPAISAGDNDFGPETTSSNITPVIEPVRKRRGIFAGTRPVLLLLGILLVAGGVGWVVYRQSTTNSPQPIRSIAVLPFKPLSPESRDEGLEMGMAETLINRLSGLSQLAVRPITAVRKYTDPSLDPVRAGEETQAEAVLDGSIQKAGDRIRVTVRLIEVASGTPIWSEKFDEEFTDIFKVQDSIAERVSDALVSQLSRQEQDRLARHETSDPAAYEEFLKCQLVWHARKANWIQQSMQCYESVLNKDPNFAAAHVGAAETYMLMSGHLMLPKKEAADKARPHIARALEIDASHAHAHNALAELSYQFDFDWARAEDEFKKALELNPNVSWIHQAYGWFLMTQGRFDEAGAKMDKAKSLDPSSRTVDVARGRLYYFTRQYEKARLQFEELIEREPDDNSLQYALFTILEQQQKYPEAVEQLLKMHLRYGGSAERADKLREAFSSGGWQGFLETQLEMQNERVAETGRVSPWFYANHYTRMGRKDEAFTWLEKSFDAGEMGNLQLKIDPLYDGLRDDPRYGQLLARIGLTP